MREILFKAKRIDNGEWVSGGSIIQLLDDGVRSIYIPQFNEKCICTQDDLTDDILGFEDCRFYKVAPSTICQYTGLTDKNGNKIWENDIAEIPIEDGYFHIKWEEDAVRFVMERDGLTIDFLNICWLHEIEVVGNIFDNKELQKEGAEE